MDVKKLCNATRMSDQLKSKKKECLKYLAETPKRNSKDYKKVFQIFKKNRNIVEGVLDNHNLDVLLLPISKKGIPSNDPFDVLTWQYPLSSNSGLPSLGFSPVLDKEKNLPIGFQLIGRFNDEERIFSVIRKLGQISITTKKDRTDKMNILSSYTIPEINSLISRIGFTTYKDFLSKNEPSSLTPEIFEKIYRKIIEDNK